jgi:hypothetical protein
MSERVVVVIDTEPTGSGALTVQDALSQVSDLFELATVPMGGESSEMVVWRLVGASMNSPLRIVAEAFPVRESVSQDVVREHSRRFMRSIRALTSGEVPSEWRHGRARKAVERVVRRGRTGVPFMELQLVQDDVGRDASASIDSILVTRQELAAADSVLSRETPKRASQRRTLGSHEGTLVRVERRAGKPTLVIRSRLYGNEIDCIVDDDLRDTFALEANFEDVWRGRRVRIDGTLVYGPSGSLEQIAATGLHLVTHRPVPTESLIDRSITSGLEVTKFLDAVRDRGAEK